MRPLSATARTADALASLRRQSRIAIATIILFGGCAAAWSMLQPIDGAVIANGLIAVETNSKAVQHPTGGTVKRLLVSEGTRVKAGDLLVQLDDTEARSALGIIMSSLVADQAKLARLRAEQLGIATMRMQADLGVVSGTATNLVVESEQKVLTTRLANREGQKAQLRERVMQLENSIEGLSRQQAALDRQRTIAEAELRDLETLVGRGLVERRRITELQRELIKLEGAIGSSSAQIAEAKGKQAEIELQLLGLDQDAASENAKDVRETVARIEELNERRTAAEDQLRRTSIHAPEEGIVHGLTLHTVGGVVSPGHVLMQIVPQATPLIVEARLQPGEIDRVQPGQATRLVLSAFNRNTTPELHGTVFRVAADLSEEERTGAAFYAVGIHIPRAEIAAIAPLTLTPGMPVEAFILTGKRTVASYLLKPLSDHMNRAMREE